MGTPVNIEIDPEQDSMVYIFDIVFECRVRHVDLLSDSDIAEFGSFRTGMELMDNDNMTQMVSANLSISKIAVHISKGYTIRFVHQQDLLKLYEFTQHHLNRWLGKMSGTSLNGGGAPVDDLIILDRFCSIIYEQAKYYDVAKLTSLEQKFGVAASFSSVLSMFSKKEGGEDARIQEISNKHRKGFGELLNEIKMNKTLDNNNGFTRPLNG